MIQKMQRQLLSEIGAKIQIIDPLSENWLDSTTEIINALVQQFN